MITANEVRKKYLDFFKSRDHVVVPSAPLIPENDPTTLFTGSGMQPMLQYLLGEPYPEGVNRIVDSQKVFRAQDVEEVGDNRHTTFFEMLGNWSLGDYFKEEQLAWYWEFLTKELAFPVEKLYVSIFEGNDEIPRDKEAEQIWLKLGVSQDHIFAYPAQKNWWARTDYSSMPVGEPGGPSSEVFYEFTQVEHDPKFGKECHPNCDCGRFLEIGNSVFMTYKKTETGFEPLEKKNIDFGGGLERTVAAINNDPDVFNIDLFSSVVTCLEQLTAHKYGQEVEVTKFIRIIADHIRGSIFMVDSGITPSNQKQGYVLRKLLRRAMVLLARLKDVETKDTLNGDYLLRPVLESVVAPYLGAYKLDIENIDQVIKEEWLKFRDNMNSGQAAVMKVINSSGDVVKGEDMFYLLESHGILPVVLEEILNKVGKKGEWEKFKELVKSHQDQSRTASKGMFKGGLEDSSETTTKYHTATHLLHAALRQVLGDGVKQKGSNITSVRVRFDFSHPAKLTPEQIAQVEQIVNQKISQDITVERLEMDKQQALDMGALAFFPEKYPSKTSVYKIGDFSLELCGGPHISSTGLIGHIKITREESAGAGVRRVYAQIE